MKLFISQRAEAEVLGHIIILSITILGIGMITIFGVPAIYNLEDMANSKNVEQAFTVLDSRASRVILGDSPLQITNIDTGGGTMSIEPNSSENPSYVVINSSSFNVTIPMGRIKYTLDDRIVSYEGGGVWAQYPGGGTVMLSPPEFHYNGWTLTLPVINISGSASVGGKGTMVISLEKMATTIQYPNATIPGRTNPVEGGAVGKVNVNIISDYYNSWADYARTLSYTNVSVNDTGRTAIVELKVISPMGTFVSIPDTITLRDINMSSPEPLNNFSFNLITSGTSWGSREVELEAVNGNKKLKIDIHHDSGDDIDIDYSYTAPGITETWNAFLISKKAPSPWNIDFLNKTLNLTFTATSCPTWLPPECTSTTNYSLYDIMQHYALLIGPDIEFKTETEKISSDISSYTLDYDPGPGALTYLHITENKVDVEIS
ncbi:hypothetical protein METP2_01834 [Methanosarcinales archaeon]|nr:hypothetical protein [Candidatus Methanoperedens sp.]CAG0978734.1 hypothetical protein METP2_01834 [Methanosarcinales archaeon]